MQTVHRLWNESDNVIMTNFNITTKNDVQVAFDRLGVSYTVSHRSNRYYDNGLLATTTADSGENGENEEWLIINWASLSESEKQSWLVA